MHDLSILAMAEYEVVSLEKIDKTATYNKNITHILIKSLEGIFLCLHNL